MSTSQKYRKLPYFFMEVCADLLYEELHIRHGVPKDGENMLPYLADRLFQIHGLRYYDIIKNCQFLSDCQKKYLFPDNGVIELKNLDLAMYIKICRLFDGRNNICWSYVNNVRNYVSHIPMENLQGNASEEDFRTDFTILKDNLYDSGVYLSRLENFEQRIMSNCAF